jgi:hypothetical protein
LANKRKKLSKRKQADMVEVALSGIPTTNYLWKIEHGGEYYQLYRKNKGWYGKVRGWEHIENFNHRELAFNAIRTRIKAEKHNLIIDYVYPEDL